MVKQAGIPFGFRAWQLIYDRVGDAFGEQMQGSLNISFADTHVIHWVWSVARDKVRMLSLSRQAHSAGGVNAHALHSSGICPKIQSAYLNWAGVLWQATAASGNLCSASHGSRGQLYTIGDRAGCLRAKLASRILHASPTPG